MKRTQAASFLWLIFFLGSWAFPVSAKPNDVGRELGLTEIRTRAENGDAEAEFRLGNSYRTGVGVLNDASEAVRWFRKAAEQGHVKAQCALGSCYADGLGVARDDIEAYKWLSLAAVQGNDRARGLKSQLALQMMPEQIANAARLVREFKPSNVPKSATPARAG